MLDLNRALARPLHEYGAQFWSPIRRVDEESQKGLTDLEQRRLEGLLIETFKVLRCFSGLDLASV